MTEASSPRALVAQARQEVESGLARLRRLAYVVDFAKIGRSAGGLQTCVDYSDAEAALLWPRLTLKKLDALLADGRAPDAGPQVDRAELLRSLKWIKEFSLAHHAEEPPGVHLHRLLVDIPDYLDHAIALLDKPADAGGRS